MTEQEHQLRMRLKDHSLLKELQTNSTSLELLYFVLHSLGIVIIMFCSFSNVFSAALLYHFLYPMDFAIQHDVCHRALKYHHLFKLSTFVSSIFLYPETFNYCIGHLNHHKVHSDSRKLESDLIAIREEGIDLFQRNADVDLRFALAKGYKIRQAHAGGIHEKLVAPYDTVGFWFYHLLASICSATDAARVHMKTVLHSLNTGSPTRFMLVINLVCNVVLLIFNPRHAVFCFLTRTLRLERLMPMWLFRRMTHFNKDFYSSHGIARPSGVIDDFSFLDRCFPSEDWTVPWWVDRFLMCGLTYHSTHHLYPRCPFYQLAALSNAWKSILAHDLKSVCRPFPLTTWICTGICRQVDSHSASVFRFACYAPARDE